MTIEEIEKMAMRWNEVERALVESGCVKMVADEKPYTTFLLPEDCIVSAIPRLSGKS